MRRRSRTTATLYNLFCSDCGIEPFTLLLKTNTNPSCFDRFATIRSVQGPDMAHLWEDDEAVANWFASNSNPDGTIKPDSPIGRNLKYVPECAAYRWATAFCLRAWVLALSVVLPSLWEAAGDVLLSLLLLCVC